MGCFLACFGFSKKRNHRRLANKIFSGDQGHGSYKPLDSDGVIENSKKGKEKLSSKTKKKVRFNLNVKSYEPLPNYDGYFSDSEDEKCEENKEETSKMGSYPSNYRYQNLSDSYDEEDDIKLEESDLDDNDSDEEYYGVSDNFEDEKTCQEEFFPEQFCSLSMESGKRMNSAQLAEDKNNFMPIVASLDHELTKLEANQKASRDRSEYVFSVLNPVENLTQWKAVKARAPQLQQQKQRKENRSLLPEQEQNIPFNYKPNSNQSKSAMQDIAVDASLSSWLVSSKTGPINRN